MMKREREHISLCNVRRAVVVGLLLAARMQMQAAGRNPVPQDTGIEKSGRLDCSGTVVDDHGEPIGGVRVKVSWFDSPGHVTGAECTTDTQGRWKMIVPAAVQDVFIYLDHPAYISDESSRAEKPPMSRLRDGTSIMVMKKGLPMRGIVRSDGGKPIENALILPHGRYATTVAGAAIEDSTTARTAADGNFILTGLAPGPRELTITASGFGPESVPVDVKADMAPVEIVMRAGGTFEGRVRDEDGKPIEGAGIYCRRWEMRRSHIVSLTARTDAKGGFRMVDAPREGSLEFYVAKRGFLSPDDTVYLPQDAPCEITLYRPPVISGTVVDDETGKPITDFDVTDGILWPGWTNISWQGSQAVHSEQGAFSKTFQRIGLRQSLPSCAVRVMAKGYIPEATPLVGIGEKSEPFMIRLHKGESWVGFINGPAGEPISNVDVAWIGPGHRAFIKKSRLQPQYEGSPEWVVQTDTTGRFELPPNRTEGWILALHETGYGWWHSSRFVRNSAVALTPWAHIEGVLQIPGADNHSAQLKIEPVEDAGQTATIPIRWFFTETSHVDGRFAFDFVPSLPLGIGHVSQDKFFLSRNLTPQPGQNIKVEITAERAGPASLASLVGSALPVIENIGIDFEPEQAKEQSLLICFFAMEQRPSRNCVSQLSKRAKELRDKGVTVVTIQASTADETALNEWVTKNNIRFVMGVVQHDYERVRLRWGVKSLPWLILTDRQHIVSAEGFGLGELDARIKEIDDAPR